MNEPEESGMYGFIYLVNVFGLRDLQLYPSSLQSFDSARGGPELRFRICC